MASSSTPSVRSSEVLVSTSSDAMAAHSSPCAAARLEGRRTVASPALSNDEVPPLSPLPSLVLLPSDSFSESSAPSLSDAPGSASSTSPSLLSPSLSLARGSRNSTAKGLRR
eukprot:scaffold12491_cov24-Tisochrysis_lutea.AAC.3